MTVPWGLIALLGIAAVLASAAAVVLLAQRLRHPPRRTAGWALARGRPVDPGDLGLAHREDQVAGMPFWIAARDESTLASPEAPTVVLLHGWGRSRRDMLDRLEPWRRRGVRMAIPDLRGHGDADGPSGLGTPEVGDVAALIDALPSGDVLLCGHSMGGVVAIHVAAQLAGGESPAARRSSRLAGVVAIAPYERVRVPAAAQLEASGFGGRGLATPVLAILRRLGVRESSTREAASRLGIPLLVLHGSDDRLCPIDDARRIAAGAGDRGTFIEIADAGHDDRRPDVLEAIEQAIEQALENWLDGRPHHRGGNVDDEDGR
ncbi:MAG: alpha/beta hydrolase [Planctomycetota bacterium]|jgi:pimeloyl-ACP methyl ester carboxylesterase